MSIDAIPTSNTTTDDDGQNWLEIQNDDAHSLQNISFDDFEECHQKIVQLIKVVKSMSSITNRFHVTVVNILKKTNAN